MSKEKSNSQDSSEATPVAKRRTAQSRSAKPAKSAKKDHSATDAPAVEPPLPSFPVFDSADTTPASEATKPSTSGEVSPLENPKRNKRRRKKGKGGGSQQAAQPVVADASAELADETPAPRPAQQARPKPDSESVAKLAWKIYLAEVSEEGVALIGDSDAKELSRRCFRLAEIFMEEQSRRG